jgi:hypothetical protein
LAALRVAYRARRPALLEGPTGIGKSELVQTLAKELGIATAVIDLSLLEPPDLVGLPIIENGRTHYALPSILPREGAGILMLEELNRAERHIQQPALQLLSARTLHEYVLPEGWVCFAAINPMSADYQVSALDPALRARFLHLQVRAERASWLSWAIAAGVHPAVQSLVRAHDRVFDDVPPRTWAYVSSLLFHLRAEELRDGTLCRDVLSGYLPPAWIETLLASREIGSVGLDVDVMALLASYPADAAAKVRGYKERGATDRIDELCHRLAAILGGPEAGVLAAKKQLSLTALEALFADLPGDHRERLQEALGGNATAVALLEIAPRDVLTNYAGSRYEKRIGEWRADPLRAHRIGLLVTGLRAMLSDPTKLAEIKKSNPARASLGVMLAQLGSGSTQRWVMPLVESMQRHGVTPIRPGA